METLKTINFNENKIVLSNHLVQSDILPSTLKEIGRDIIVDGQAEINGAVFAKNLFVNGGPLTVSGAIFAQNEIHIKNDITEKVHFKKAVGCSASLSGLLTQSRIDFWGDITAKRVALKNAFIAGSVLADEIDLDSCVVMGGVFATKKLTLRNVVTGTFNGPEAFLAGNVYLLMPAAFSVEPITSGPDLAVWNLAMADLLSLYFSKPEKEASGGVKMDPTVDSLAIQLFDDKGDKQTIRSFSVAGKVMMAGLSDFESLNNHFILRTGAMAGHLAKTFNLPEGELDPATVAALFFDILAGRKAVRELKATVSFEELKKRYA